MDNRETHTTLGTQDTGQINVRENLGNIKNEQSRDTDNIGYTRHSAIQKKETMQRIKLKTRAIWMPSINDILEYRFLQNLIIGRRR